MLVHGEANVDILPESVARHKNQQQADYLSRISVHIDDCWDQPGHKLLRWMSLGGSAMCEVAYCCNTICRLPISTPASGTWGQRWWMRLLAIVARSSYW